MVGGEDGDDDGEEEEEKEGEEEEVDHGWDTEWRGKRMPVGTRVLVNEGTAPGVNGRRTGPYIADISRHLSDCRYGVVLHLSYKHQKPT
jgi:hypothetical protein